MKRLFLAALCCMMGIAATWADEVKNVRLSSDNSREVVQMGFCNVIVSLTNAGSDDQRASVQLEVENLDQSNIKLVLFDRGYNAKALKKMRNRMKIGFNESAVTPYTYSTGDIPQQMLLLNPSQMEALPQLTIDEDNEAVVTLPIYMAKEKRGFFDKLFGKKKLVLMEKIIVELHITAEMRPSQEYLNMENAYQTLKNEVNATTFCTNRAHRPSGTERQMEPYKQRLDALLAQIDAAISQRGGQDAPQARRYVNLRSNVTRDIVLENHVGDCGRHNRATHQCQYCSWSLSRIYQEMDRIYRTIYNSNDRQAAKQANMAKVNALYQCCTATDCTRHRQAWSSGGSDKTNIERCYSRIQGL
ncbi:MAG: hypothetical protein IJT98_01405 [Prevotella sp.]|nr:hypothetical protein [Prevotella sp.]